jgi:hypothetical protein
VSVAAASPRLSDLRLAPRTLRPAAQGSSILTGPHAGGAAAPGALVSFSVSQAGSITFTVVRAKPGVRVHSGGACRAAPERPAAGSRPCLRRVVVGSFRQPVTAGAGRLRFSGLIAGHRLSGSYVLQATPHARSGAAGPPVTVSFVVT